MKKQKIGFASACVHHAEKEKIINHPHCEPIYATSTFFFESAEQGMKAFNGE